MMSLLRKWSVLRFADLTRSGLWTYMLYHWYSAMFLGVLFVGRRFFLLLQMVNFLPTQNFSLFLKESTTRSMISLLMAGP
jgi:hypothetical protein